MSFAIPPRRFDDPAVFGRVAVLMGGTSAERAVSLDSGNGVLAALRSRGVDAHAVDGIPALVDGIRAGKFDRVFNILHGNKGGGEDGVVQGLLEALGVPCTGPGVLGSALTMDKIRTKQVWIAAGLPTPRFVRIAPGGDPGSSPGQALRAAVRELGLPVFVKPSCEGSSVGVFRIRRKRSTRRGIRCRLRGELLVSRWCRAANTPAASSARSRCRRSASCPPASGTTTTPSTSPTTRTHCPHGGRGRGRDPRAVARGVRAAGCSGWGAWTMLTANAACS